MGRMVSGALRGASAPAALTWDTIVVTATTAAIRAAPCRVRGGFATAAGTVTIYANSANSGTLIFPATAVTAGQALNIAPYLSFLGLSVTLAGGAQINLEVQ